MAESIEFPPLDNNRIIELSQVISTLGKQFLVSIYLRSDIINVVLLLATLLTIYSVVDSE